MKNMRRYMMTNVLITGAAKGIGLATALHLDRQGHTVFAGVRSRADGEALCEMASSRMQPVVLDVTDAAQIIAAAKVVKLAVGENGLHGLINNAGMAAAAP